MTNEQSNKQSNEHAEIEKQATEKISKRFQVNCSGSIVDSSDNEKEANEILESLKTKWAESMRARGYLRMVNGKEQLMAPVVHADTWSIIDSQNKPAETSPVEEMLT